MPDLLEHIRDRVVAAYGSLEDPNWFFVRRQWNADPYGAVRDEIAQRLRLRDDTDLNYDRSFVWLVDTADGGRVVRVSMVGPYAVVLTCRKWPLGCDVIVPGREVDNDDRTITAILVKHELLVLDAETLSSPMPLHGLLNVAPNECKVYHALFEDAEGVPGV